MTTITTRAVKGEALTHTEIDANFTNLNTDKTEKSTLTTKGDIYVATAASTLARLAIGSNTQVLTADSTTSTGVKWATGGGDALTTNPLSQFAATTSAQLAGVLSDETGTGAVVFATSPALVTPLLGTPTSGTLTNCTSLPVAGITASTSTALGVGSIELGHATDTTITRTGAGAIAVEGTAVLLSGGALGTPASGTLTNATGLPVAGITASTSTALGVGSIELGHATDTTLTRVSAGVVAVEGSNVLLASGLGSVTQAYDAQLADIAGLTYAQGDILYYNGTNVVNLGPGTSGYFLKTQGAAANPIWANIPGGGDALVANPLSQFAATTSLQLAGVISDETGSGALVFATSPTLVTPALGTPASGTLTNCTSLPVAGITASTSTALGVGSVELGHASDTTVSRSSAGVIAVEGDPVVTRAQNNTFSKAQRGSVTTLTDAVNIATDLNLNNFFSVTLAGNRTLDNPTNIVPGQSGCIFITQDATGSRTLVYGTYWDFAGGTAPTLSTAANSVDRLDYVVRTATSIHSALTKAWS